MPAPTIAPTPIAATDHIFIEWSASFFPDTRGQFGFFEVSHLSIFSFCQKEVLRAICGET